jgi:hypothetical protein
VSFLLLEAVGVGVAGIAEKAAIAIKATGMGARLFSTVGRALAFFARIAELAKDLAAVPLFRIWQVTTELTEGALKVLTARYPRAMELLTDALKLMGRSADAGKVVLEAFARVAGMPDDVAKRLLAYMVERAEQGGNPRFLYWLDVYKRRNVIQEGVAVNRAVKEAFEAAPEAGAGLADELNEILVAAADAINRGDAVGADNLVRAFVQKYRNPGLPGPPRSLEEILRAFRKDAADTRFTQGTINEAIRVHADNIVAPWKNEALEGTARIIQENGTDGPVIMDRFIKETELQYHPRLETASERLGLFNDPEKVKAAGRLVKDGEAENTALFISNVNHAGIEEQLVDAVDRLRRGDGTLISGVSTKPQGRGASPLMNTLADAPNKGFAYEAVGTHKMVARGEYTLDEIAEMGRRFDVVMPDQTIRTLEANAFVVKANKRIMVDYKLGDSVGSGLITDDELERVVRALSDVENPFDEVVFAASGTVTSERVTKIADLNQQLRQAFPGRFTTDPIRVVGGLGGF